MLINPLGSGKQSHSECSFEILNEDHVISLPSQITTAKMSADSRRFSVSYIARKREVTTMLYNHGCTQSINFNVTCRNVASP